MTFRTSGQTDISSWLAVWEGGVYMTSMCIKQGKKGIRSQMGLNNHLFLEVGTLPRPWMSVATS